MPDLHQKYYSIINLDSIDDKQVILIKKRNNKNEYFGLSPKINENFICDLLNRDILENKEEFFKFVKNNKKYFSLPEDNNFFQNNSYKDTIISLFARAIICSSFNFTCTNGLISATEYLQIPEYMRDKYKFNLNEVGENWKIIGYLDQTFKNYLFQTFNIEFTDYKHSNNIGNHAYYSGVIPRLTSVKNIINEKVSSSDIWLFSVIKTTYFTIDSFENIKYNNHHLLQDYLDSLLNFDNYNANLIEKFINTNKDNISSIAIQKQLKNLNTYLQNSLHTNNMGVTGNIITSDNKLILAKRSGTAIDANQIYPSVNGNAEILDTNVDFYKSSNYEDLPSIDLQNKFSKSFDKELTRETIAELNTVNFSKKWKFIGLSTLFSFENKNKFQFNIIATTKTYSDYSEIFELQALASESFENSSIIGIEFIFYQNILNLIWQYFHKYISNIKNLIAGIFSCFSISMLFYSIFAQQDIVLNDIISIASFGVLSFLSVYVLLFSFFKNKKINKTKLKLHIKNKSNLTYIESKITKHKFFKNSKFNLVTINAITNHILILIKNKNKSYWN